MSKCEVRKKHNMMRKATESYTRYRKMDKKKAVNKK